MTNFEELFKVNVNEHVEEKNGLNYLSWAWAWAEVKKRFPGANYEVKKFDGLPYIYDEKTGYMVYTSVTIEGETLEMWLPVMDGANKAMKSEPYDYAVWDRYKKEWKSKTCLAATMFDVNKTVMRCLTKNLAMFGLGLYIYAGEDLPTTEAEPVIAKAQEPAQTIGVVQVMELERLLKDTNSDVNAFLKFYGVKALTEMTEEKYKTAIQQLERKAKKFDDSLLPEGMR